MILIRCDTDIYKVGVSFGRGINNIDMNFFLTSNTLDTLYSYWREITNERELLHLKVDIKTSDC